TRASVLGVARGSFLISSRRVVLMPSRADMEAKAASRMRQRQEFESSDVGQRRMTGITPAHTQGASLKQYYHHMGVGGSEHPHAADFYEPQSETGQVLRGSARETKTPFHEHTAALAMTSNQTTFKHPTSTIAGGYFNNALARSASVQEQAGVDPSTMKLPIRE